MPGKTCNASKVIRLEGVLQEQQVEAVRFWKLDVELDALRGAERLLGEQRIRYIFYECHPSNYQDIRQLLAGFGYQVFDLQNQRLVAKTANAIANTENLAALPTT